MLERHDSAGHHRVGAGFLVVLTVVALGGLASGLAPSHLSEAAAAGELYATDCQVSDGTARIEFDRAASSEPDLDLRIVRSRAGLRVADSDTASVCVLRVDEIDRIVVDLSRVPRYSRLILAIQRGPIGPGATSERRGKSEIEIKLKLNKGFKRRGLYGSELRIFGGDGSEHISAGRLRGRAAGVNLNAGERGDRDVDLKVTTRKAVGEVPFSVFGYGGDDELLATGGSGFRGQLRPGLALSETMFHGSSGDDTLAAGAGPRAELYGVGGADHLTGGPGDDVLEGGGDRDSLRGGLGRDRLDGGHDDDQIHAVDRPARKDRLICKEGDDFAVVDELDMPRADCETVQGPG